VQPREYVGIDLHRRRSVIVRLSEEREVLSVKRIANDPIALALAVAEAGEGAEVAIEACYGWYWAVDTLQQAGVQVHLASPSGLDWGKRRVKNDVRDARDLARMLRMGELPEAWIAPPEVRELRELVRYRAKLVALRSGLKAQVHAVMAKEGILPTVGDMFGIAGNRALDALEMARNYTTRVESLRDLIALYDREVTMLERQIRVQLREDRGYKAIQAIPGVGPTMAAIFVAEIGDVHRFPSAEKLCSWAGLTPKHRDSDTKIVRLKITKQGSRLIRWAAIEAVANCRGGTPLQVAYHRLAERRGKQKARVAVARRLLTLVYYGLRDGEIRCLGKEAA
jgi:transposase